jgi:excisionase family DNA binding protein
MTAASDLLTADEVAKILRLHKVTVLRKARAGEIESVLIGRNRRFRRSAIDAHLDSCTMPASTPATTSTPQPSRTQATPQRPTRNPNRTYKS